MRAGQTGVELRMLYPRRDHVRLGGELPVLCVSLGGAVGCSGGMGCWSGGGRDRWVRSARPVRVMCHEGFCGGCGYWDFAPGGNFLVCSVKDEFG